MKAEVKITVGQRHPYYFISKEGRYLIMWEDGSNAVRIVGRWKQGTGHIEVYNKIFDGVHHSMPIGYEAIINELEIAANKIYEYRKLRGWLT